jgi:hypothetical protein
MRTLMTRSMIAVAALAVAAASASAQTYKAEVPMSFRVGTKVLAPGSYQFRVVNALTGNHVVSVSNTATHRGALLLSFPGSDAPQAWRAAGNVVISFECLDGNCAPRRMWDGTGTTTYEFRGLKLRPAEQERITSITVALNKAD